MTVYTPKRLALGVVATLALLAAGCGGGPAGSSESGATLVRAGALGYVSIDTDIGSSQWQQVDALSKKFPGRALALSRIESELTKQGLDFARTSSQRSARRSTWPSSKGQRRKTSLMPG